MSELFAGQANVSNPKQKEENLQPFPPPAGTVAGGLVTVSSFCHFVESSKPTPFPLQSELFTLISFTDEETEAPRDDVTGPSSQWALSSLFWGATLSSTGGS